MVRWSALACLTLWSCSAFDDFESVELQPQPGDVQAFDVAPRADRAPLDAAPAEDQGSVDVLTLDSEVDSSAPSCGDRRIEGDEACDEEHPSCVDCNVEPMWVEEAQVEGYLWGESYDHFAFEVSDSINQVTVALADPEDCERLVFQTMFEDEVYEEDASFLCEPFSDVLPIGVHHLFVYPREPAADSEISYSINFYFCGDGIESEGECSEDQIQYCDIECLCGNGRVDSILECESLSDEYCEEDCEFEDSVCGNHHIDEGECEDWNAPSYCALDCISCDNMVIDHPWECAPENPRRCALGDCIASGSYECGDGVVNDEYECDQHNPLRCEIDCYECGNHQIDNRWECDSRNHSRCSEDCDYIYEEHEILCGNGEIDHSRECEIHSPRFCELDCQPSFICGNRAIDNIWECDFFNPERCHEDCEFSIRDEWINCGDYIVGSHYECDDEDSPVYCPNDCEIEGTTECGNHIIDERWECQPGFIDYCPEDCNYEDYFCGNLYVDSDWECDFENENRCSLDCDWDGSICGDGEISDPWRECNQGRRCPSDCGDCGNQMIDPGECTSYMEFDMCDTDCNQEFTVSGNSFWIVCGDGVVNHAWECSWLNPGRCHDDCPNLEPVCGNGVIDNPEECEGEQACEEDCGSCGNGSIEPGECFDADPYRYCFNDCWQLTGICGNGVIDTPFECSEHVNYRCYNDCDYHFYDEINDYTAWIGCGNGTIDHEEECNLNSPRYCSLDCGEFDAFDCGNGKIDSLLECDFQSNNNNPNCRSDCHGTLTTPAGHQIELECGDGNINHEIECLQVLGERMENPYFCEIDCAQAVEYLENNIICGDGIISHESECDPARNTYCERDCRYFGPNHEVIYCGDGIALPESWECDPRNLRRCINDCPPACGDGKISGLSECNINSNSYCEDDCIYYRNRELIECGDGQISGSECEENGRFCPNDCGPIIRPPVDFDCNNGRIDSLNECDFSNPLRCSADCDWFVFSYQISCGDGFANLALHECDPGDHYCGLDCDGLEITGCGDGYIIPADECSNRDSGDWCEEDCFNLGGDESMICGDGIVNPLNPWECSVENDRRCEPDCDPMNHPNGICGDGLITSPRECERGLIDLLWCEQDCTYEDGSVCGDGIGTNTECNHTEGRRCMNDCDGVGPGGDPPN